MATTGNMELDIVVEQPSAILRKLKIKVPAKVVKNYIDKGLVDVQKTAKLKGFRPGQAPISIIKQYYGDDVRHRVMHNLIDESFQEAVRGKELKTVGSPKIETPNHKTGTGAHDHTLHEDQDLNYEATFEVMPEVKVKGYTGIALEQETVDITDENVEKVVENIQSSQAQLIPAEPASRPVKKGDFVDTQMSGGIVEENVVHERADLKGSKLIEVGVDSWIPGFDDNLIGMKQAEEKTFRVKVPSDFGFTQVAGKELEFQVTINDIKEKKLPVLDDEFAKQMGYESVADLKTKAREYLQKERTEESDRKVRSELVGKIIEKNSFDVPTVLVESQTRSLAQEWAQELKKQGFQDKMIQDTLEGEIANLRTRAESQVRASLILEAIAKEEKISVQPEDISAEIDRLSVSMQMEKAKLQEFYIKNAGRKADLEFRLRQERTVEFLLGKSKVKKVAPATAKA